MGKVAGAVAKKAKAGSSGKKKSFLGSYSGSNMGVLHLKKHFGKPKAAAPAAPAPAPRHMKRRFPSRYAQP